MSTSVDHRLPDAVQLVSRALRAHGGGAELVDAVPGPEPGRQAITLRLTGLCRGCPYWPVTLETTISPLLRRELGDVSVDIDGRRISDEAKQRLLEIGVTARLPLSTESTSEAPHGH